MKTERWVENGDVNLIYQSDLTSHHQTVLIISPPVECKLISISRCKYIFQHFVINISKLSIMSIISNVNIIKVIKIQIPKVDVRLL